jgi:hypothetical protein
MHFVHITCLTRRPFFRMDTFWRLGFQFRLVARKENERLCPKEVVLPQFAHLAIVHNPFNDPRCFPALAGTALYHKSYPSSTGSD